MTCNLPVILLSSLLFSSDSEWSFTPWPISSRKQDKANWSTPGISVYFSGKAVRIMVIPRILDFYLFMLLRVKLRYCLFFYLLMQPKCNYRSFILSVCNIQIYNIQIVNIYWHFTWHQTLIAIVLKTTKSIVHGLFVKVVYLCSGLIIALEGSGGKGRLNLSWIVDDWIN